MSIETLHRGLARITRQPEDNSESTACGSEENVTISLRYKRVMKKWYAATSAAYSSRTSRNEPMHSLLRMVPTVGVIRPSLLHLANVDPAATSSSKRAKI